MNTTTKKTRCRLCYEQIELQSGPTNHLDFLCDACKAGLEAKD